MVLHALDTTEELSADVAGRQRQRVALVRPLVDDQVVVLREGPLAEAALVALDSRSALPASGAHRLEAFGRGHGGAIHRVDGEHGDDDRVESEDQRKITNCPNISVIDSELEWYRSPLLVLNGYGLHSPNKRPERKLIVE